MEASRKSGLTPEMNEARIICYAIIQASQIDLGLSLSSYRRPPYKQNIVTKLISNKNRFIFWF